MFEAVADRITTVEINETTVEYYDNQSSADQVMICLPSTTNRPHIFYDLGESLKEEIRLISFGYPVIDSIEDYHKIIITMLEQLGIDEFYLLGYEHGGLIAQSLLASLQQRCRGLILLHSSTKTSEINDNIVKSHVKNLKRLIKSHQGFIQWLFRRKYKRGIKQGFKAIAIEQKKTYENFYINLFMDTSIEALANVYRLLLDLWDRPIVFDEQFRTYDGKVLIVESKEEREKATDEQKQLKQVFNQYEVILLAGNKKLSLVKNRQKILEIIKAFIA